MKSIDSGSASRRPVTLIVTIDCDKNLNNNAMGMKRRLEINLRHTPWAWLILLLILETVEAQTNNDPTKSSRDRRYHVKVTLVDGQKVKGILKLIGDNRMQLLERKTIGKARTGVDEVPDTLHYSDIQTIKIRSVGATIGGTIGGSVIGVIIGGVVGWFAPPDECSSDPTCVDDYDLRIITGVLGAAAGGVVGAVGGAQLGPPSFDVMGQYQNFQQFRARMKKKGMEVD